MVWLHRATASSQCTQVRAKGRLATPRKRSAITEKRPPPVSTSATYMASPVLNHLQVDALLPLPKEEHGHGHGQGHEAAASADLSAGFTRVPLTLCPPFSSEVR